jgi:hypothetical protein
MSSSARATLQNSRSPLVSQRPGPDRSLAPDRLEAARARARTTVCARNDASNRSCSTGSTAGHLVEHEPPPLLDDENVPGPDELPRRRSC